MRRVTDELRAAWASLKAIEGDLPGYDYDRGYLTGWYERRRRSGPRYRPNGSFRSSERVREFRAGYVHGWEGGADKAVDWWPDYARGRLDPATHEGIPGSADLDAAMSARAMRDAEQVSP